MANGSQLPLECLKTPKGYEYKGHQNKTASGRTCQAWTSQTTGRTQEDKDAFRSNFEEIIGHVERETVLVVTEHFPNSFRLVPRRSRPVEAELVLCQRLSPINNMASVETYSSSTTELEGQGKPPPAGYDRFEALRMAAIYDRHWSIGEFLYNYKAAMSGNCRAFQGKVEDLTTEATAYGQEEPK
ncbi:hypothetical protein LSAT2_015857 [Lamellibrachia satsuma]|nr:hypothetical protein LSAT2_015857 [Lamellibrachia satsuma]